MSIPQFTITDEAYVTITMHATKYTHGISGLLLGKYSTTNKTDIQITTAIPFAHSQLAIHTTPLTETALHLSEQISTSRQLNILGIYYANENSSDKSIGIAPTKMADLIRQHNPNAVLLIINVQQFTPSIRLTKHCFNVHIKEEQTGTWGRGLRDSSLLTVSKRALIATDAIMKGKLGNESFSYSVADFEDHCTDPSCDWLNIELIKKLDHLLTTIT